MTEPTMTGDDLRRWRIEMGSGGRAINQPTAARMLGISQRTITGYETGEFPVPVAIMYACQYLLDNRERTAAEPSQYQRLNAVNEP
jgi:predicted transcriptional regulator